MKNKDVKMGPLKFNFITNSVFVFFHFSTFKKVEAICSLLIARGNLNASFVK